MYSQCVSELQYSGHQFWHVQVCDSALNTPCLTHSNVLVCKRFLYKNVNNVDDLSSHLMTLSVYPVLFLSFKYNISTAALQILNYVHVYK